MARLVSFFKAGAIFGPEFFHPVNRIQYFLKGLTGFDVYYVCFTSVLKLSLLMLLGVHFFWIYIRLEYLLVVLCTGKSGC